MADDLDAFFDEVSAAEAEAVDEIVEKESTKNDADIVPPPAKKAKKTNDKPIRPVGVVVAAASSAPRAAQKVPPNILPTTTADAMLATATTITATAAKVTVAPPPPPLPPGPPPPPPPPPPPNKTNKKPHVRTAAGETWIDPTLNEWPENDFRIFVGNLDKIVTDQQLYNHFAKYPSLAKAKVVRDKVGASKGYGFVSMLKPLEMARAIREMDQSWLSSRPIRTKRSDWKERDLKTVVKKTRKANR
jgi:hypothetical protein